ncbi:alpha/beta-type small acid-soluble spore protein [Clostridium sp. 'deep sea']|jgi:small acid-soluble spore protein alpha/beta type|uniref:alpha/beta-type small acid-soluble spore protein n=1 Tax=Clostridium sp. 'deep sea' TaxID=2779445 RepID=UPI0018965641|nr:alpha/beta-type small acid-soluble spore protein [Clostridium sp. 'deep sea']QOR36181.1 alpha/beta-type small acid-soluble spore protein [Clostridium sp. 'deep sea']
MAKGSNSHVVPGAYKAMEQFKYEIANELGIQGGIQNGYWGNLSSRDCGSVGGEMVRRMIEIAEQQLSGTKGGSTY